MEFNQLRKLIIKSILGEASGEEQHLLEQWRAESEANQQLFDKCSSELFLKKAVLDKNKEMRLREWKKLQSKTVYRKRSVFRLNWVRVAAAVFILGLGTGAAWLFFYRMNKTELIPFTEQIRPGSSRAIIELAGGEQFQINKDSVFDLETHGIQLMNRQDTLILIRTLDKNVKGAEYNTIRIPNGGEYITRLEDGSVIHLNAGSELKVPVRFGINDREVWLKGEAYFEVARNEKLPFTVHTGKADISVLGTQFDVRAYADEKEVVTTLVQGMVEVSAGHMVSRLKPGEQACVEENGNISTVEVNVYPFIAWKSGRIVFEDKSLEYIMIELQRWYDFEVFFADPKVKDIRFTMDILKYDDISKVLSLMQKMDKVTFTRKGRTIVLGGH